MDWKAQRMVSLSAEFRWEDEDATLAFDKQKWLAILKLLNRD